VHYSGESVALLEAILTEGFSQVGAKSGYVGGATGKEHPVDIGGIDAGLFQRRVDRLLDQV
jgi:hypothetical protein